MNPIVTVEMYRAHNTECELTDAKLENVLDVAQQTVNAAVCGRLAQFDRFESGVQENITKAIMAQTDYIAVNFGADMAESVPQSASIGSFSYSLGGSGSSESSESSGSSPASLDLIALTYLRTTGLLYRGDICAL